MGDKYDVIMAAYPEVEAAEKDFDALVALVEAKKIRTEGVILVERDADGEVHVSQTGDHLGRKGAGWGGGVGVLVGLAAPPLLASVAVGAAAGGLVGKFMHHKVESGMESGLGDKLKPGTAAIIAMVDDEDRLAAERALPGTPAKSVAAMDKKGVRGLKDALAEAALKFVPDRTVLPIPDPAFGGVIGRSLRTSAADWTINMTPTPPEGAPNVLVVLIDDAGFGNPSTFGGARPRRRLHARRRVGPPLQPFPRHGGLLADACGDAHRPQSPPVGYGLVSELPRPLPRLQRVEPQGLRDLTCVILQGTATRPGASASGT